MSARDLDSDLLAGAQSAEFKYVVLIRLDFPTGEVRVHNSVGTIEFNGADYLGVGGFGSIDAIEDSIELVEQSFKMTLSSVTPAIIEAINGTDVYGRDADIFLGSLDDDFQLIGSPTNWISGYMESAALSIGTDNMVTLSIQTDASRLKVRNNRRFTHEEHQKEWPGEKIFEFLPYVMQADVDWGGDKVRTGFNNDDSNIGSDTDGGERGPRNLNR